jgi:hypothetical protein
MPDIDHIRGEIEHMRVQIGRPGNPAAPARWDWDRLGRGVAQQMLDKVDGLSAERDRLKKDLPGPSKGNVLGGRRW